MLAIVDALSTRTKVVAGAAVASVAVGTAWFFNPGRSGAMLAVALTLLLILAAVFLVFWLRKARARSKSEQLAQGLTSDQRVPNSLSKEAAEQIRQRFVDTFRLMQRQPGMCRDYLYRQPFVVLIGETGAGKTTTLRYSGLDFPFGGEQQGVGGTLNCDWWIANQGIVLDTAGKYSSELTAEQSNKEWKKILGLLKRFRPRQPINGVIVAIPVTALYGSSEAAAIRQKMRDKAVELRKRLQELQTELSVRFPVWLVVTKCDRLVGFREFCMEMPGEFHNQLLGWTNPAIHEEQLNLENLSKGFDDIHAELSERRTDLFARRNFAPSQSDILYLFPDAFRRVFTPLRTYIEVLFSKSPYFEPHFFRGVYFTSGTQDLKVIADDIYEPVAAMTPTEQDHDVMTADYGKSHRVSAEQFRPQPFFVRDFYTEVVFPESGLVRPIQKVASRSRVISIASIAAASAILLCALSWGLYMRTELADRIGPVNAQLDEIVKTAGLQRQHLTIAVDGTAPGQARETKLPELGHILASFQGTLKDFTTLAPFSWFPPDIPAECEKAYNAAYHLLVIHSVAEGLIKSYDAYRAAQVDTPGDFGATCRTLQEEAIRIRDTLNALITEDPTEPPQTDSVASLLKEPRYAAVPSYPLALPITPSTAKRTIEDRMRPPGDADYAAKITAAIARHLETRKKTSSYAQLTAEIGNLAAAHKALADARGTGTGKKIDALAAAARKLHETLSTRSGAPQHQTTKYDLDACRTLGAGQLTEAISSLDKFSFVIPSAVIEKLESLKSAGELPAADTLQIPNDYLTRAASDSTEVDYSRLTAFLDQQKTIGTWLKGIHTKLSGAANPAPGDQPFSFAAYEDAIAKHVAVPLADSTLAESAKTAAAILGEAIQRLPADLQPSTFNDAVQWLAARTVAQLLTPDRETVQPPADWDLLIAEFVKFGGLGDVLAVPKNTAVPPGVMKNELDAFRTDLLTLVNERALLLLRAAEAMLKNRAASPFSVVQALNGQPAPANNAVLKQSIGKLQALRPALELMKATLATPSKSADTRVLLLLAILDIFHPTPPPAAPPVESLCKLIEAYTACADAWRIDERFWEGMGKKPPAQKPGLLSCNDVASFLKKEESGIASEEVSLQKDMKAFAARISESVSLHDPRDESKLSAGVRETIPIFAKFDDLIAHTRDAIRKKAKTELQAYYENLNRLGALPLSPAARGSSPPVPLTGEELMTELRYIKVPDDRQVFWYNLAQHLSPVAPVNSGDDHELAEKLRSTLLAADKICKFFFERNTLRSEISLELWTEMGSPSLIGKCDPIGGELSLVKGLKKKWPLPSGAATHAAFGLHLKPIAGVTLSTVPGTGPRAMSDDAGGLKWMCPGSTPADEAWGWGLFEFLSTAVWKAEHEAYVCELALQDPSASNGTPRETLRLFVRLFDEKDQPMYLPWHEEVQSHGTPPSPIELLRTAKDYFGNRPEKTTRP